MSENLPLEQSQIPREERERERERGAAKCVPPAAPAPELRKPPPLLSNPWCEWLHARFVAAVLT